MTLKEGDTITDPSGRWRMLRVWRAAHWSFGVKRDRTKYKLMLCDNPLRVRELSRAETSPASRPAFRVTFAVTSSVGPTIERLLAVAQPSNVIG